jgi:hypothetical protein
LLGTTAFLSQPAGTGFGPYCLKTGALARPAFISNQLQTLPRPHGLSEGQVVPSRPATDNSQITVNTRLNHIAIGLVIAL